MKRILIIGQSGHGKTEFRNCLRHVLSYYYNQPVATFSTSDFLIEQVARNHDAMPSFIKAHKEEYRQELIELGTAMNDANPGVLVDICLYAAKASNAGFCVVDGVRRANEFAETKDQFGHIVYVKRPGQPPRADNFQLSEDDADVVVLNNKGLIALETAAENFCTRYLNVQ